MLEFKNLKNEDPEIYEAITKEKKRQQDNLEMIASENFTSEAVMEATMLDVRTLTYQKL